MFGLGGDGFRDAGRGGGVAGFLRLLAWPFRLVWAAVKLPLAAAGLFRVGWGGRQTRHLVQGLPALIGILCVVFLTAAAAVSRQSLPEQYRQAAEVAEAEGDVELALTLYDRLARLDGGKGGTAFGRGQLLSRAGRDAEAVALMRALTMNAPPEPRAHVWLAERLLNGPGVTLDEGLVPRMPAERNGAAAPDGGVSDGLPGDGGDAGPYRPAEQDVEDAVRHLAAALRSGLARNPRVNRQLGGILSAMGYKPQAVQYVKVDAEANPERLLAYGNLLREVGRGQQAEAVFRQAAVYYQERALDDPGDVAAYRALAFAHVNGGSPASAVRALRAGMAGSATPDPVLAAMLAELLARDAARLGAGRSGEAVEKLQEALKLAPRSKMALMKLAGLAAGGDAAADAALDDLLAGGSATGVVHLAAGLRAGGKGDDDGALFHFGRAFDLDPSLAEAANNFAYMLARGSKPQPERALEIMNDLVARFPDVPTFRDTRGGILVILGRPEEAVVDLERALSGGMAGNRGLHLALAKAYEDLGRGNLAAAHRRRVAGADRAAGRPAEFGTGAAAPTPEPGAETAPAGAAAASGTSEEGSDDESPAPAG